SQVISPRLLAWAKPRFSHVTTRNAGNSPSTSARVPSVDWLSATTTSSAISPACSMTLRKQGRSQCASFVETMMIARSSIRRPSARRSTGEATRSQLARRRVDSVDRLLVSEPLDQLGHPLLEGYARAKAEQLLGAPGVGVAVSDVAGAVLGGPVRLDVQVEPLRQQP